ncbi:MAG: ADP-ribosylglycohydrolase family protein [Erysipelotrichaceae bacterium]|nr:ADP-ribosylglycohydrolase family protein [Erysipelotrichaceae bacterium]
MKRTIEHFKASLLAGAVGDALGWPVEFRSYNAIIEENGSSGVTKLQLNTQGIAEITDDTQMTLFTLEGIVNHRYLKKFSSLNESVFQSYLRWYKTQSGMIVSLLTADFDLMSYTQLFHRRAPGLTCTTTLAKGIMGTVKTPINDSKGCGGVMRVAPIGYFYDKDLAYDYGCACAAITHGHPLGYLSAGAFAYMMSLIFDGVELKDSVLQTISKLEMSSLAKRQVSLLNQALILAESDQSDIQCIQTLGEGWVGEEALAIAVFCSLRYSNDLIKALSVSVTHDGDSDSTGSITGNILGAFLGMDAIKEEWLKVLEVTEIVITFCNYVEQHDKS